MSATAVHVPVTLAIVLIGPGFARQAHAQAGVSTDSPRTAREVQANPTFPQAAPAPAGDARLDWPSNATPAADAVDPLKRPIQRPDTGRAEFAAGDSPGNPVWTTLGLLCLLLTGLYVVLRLLRRFGPRRFSSVEREHIELVDRQRLDAQMTVYLLRVGRRVIAAASSPGGVNVLAEINDPDEVAELCRHESALEAGGKSVRSLFATGGTIRREPEPPGSETVRRPPVSAAAASPAVSGAGQEAWHA